MYLYGFGFFFIQTGRFKLGLILFNGMVVPAYAVIDVHLPFRKRNFVLFGYYSLIDGDFSINLPSILKEHEADY